MFPLSYYREDKVANTHCRKKNSYKPHLHHLNKTRTVPQIHSSPLGSIRLSLAVRIAFEISMYDMLIGYTTAVYNWAIQQQKTL